ncbi:alpha/beta hydrolase [Evtepia sp.]|uniref:alpha/beta fold hydrolase n=1 Tax=Evtepia sp. TaxID=2773933 RepID=UPI002A840145|nr:alpha/beta hydrolase [Evtepia sp.]MDY3993465.1 alpha/beta hydrolase [Evtepia sp.]MDY4429804.1 alpha/beta hydrolase [Evtepia sp.]
MDISLHYLEKGQGKPLILLHGNGEDNSYFVYQVAYFSRFYRVMAIDTRGHGQSPRGTAPFSIQQFAEDLRGFLDQHDIPKAHILGFSDGGNIALTFALHYPERVDRLILNGANLFPAGVKPTVQLPIVLGYHTASLFAKRSPKAKENAALLGLMVKEPNIRPEELNGLTVPTLVIAGTKDMIRESHTRLIARSLPNARLVLLPGDHFIANKEPAAFNRAVRDFLNEEV